MRKNKTRQPRGLQRSVRCPLRPNNHPKQSNKGQKRQSTGFWPFSCLQQAAPVAEGRKDTQIQTLAPEAAGVAFLFHHRFISPCFISFHHNALRKWRILSYPECFSNLLPVKS
jgi:hypothetical protein